MPKFTITTPGFCQQTFDLPDGKYPLGRGMRNMVVISDQSVSTEHCELLINGDEVIVRECGSRNGTYVNDVPVQSQSPVQHLQKIRVGHVEIRLDLPTPEEDSTPVTAIYDFQSAEKALCAEKPALKFPLVFTPLGSSISVSEGNTMIFRAPTAPTPVYRPLEEEMAEEDPMARRKYVYLAIGAGAMLVILWVLARVFGWYK